MRAMTDSTMPSALSAPPARIDLAPGLSISRIVTGLWQVADMERGGRLLDPATAADALQAYSAAGFDTFDMADHYGSAEVIAGGQSNITAHVRDATGRDLVVRRPPLHGVLPTAHDMGREHRIIAALGPTPVPVPEAFAYCDDADVIGAPFYVMSYVEGIVLNDDATMDWANPGKCRSR